MLSERAKRSVLFRCDGSATIGTGHIHRCLSLAAALAERGFQTAFATRPLPQAPIERIERAGHRVHLLEAELSGAEDCEATLVFATDWVVVDRYASTTRDLEQLSASGVRIAAIDDLCAQAFPVALLLNQNANATALDYRTRADTLRLFGPHFALLAPAYAHARESAPRTTHSIQRILLFLGGGDVLGPLANLLRGFAALARAESFVVRIVVGSPFYEAATTLARAALPTARVEHGHPTLIDCMQWADLFITAGGSVVWEACCLGLPMLILSIADNQEGNAQRLDQLGAALYAGSLQQLSDKALLEALDATLSQQARVLACARVAWQLVDGQGAQRVADAMERYGT
jgi:UDP-2,4-diacetamido-2,4,6-trideoxy-beta-L-altropyranose hydrolase